jgi:DNA-binding transcriptional LysR family regulator
MTDDLEGLAVFAAVAQSTSLRAAGERLGVSGSAVSQALRKLEERLGVALVQRTTRSLRLTDAGEQLFATVGRSLAEMRAATAAVGELGSEPGGTLRLLVAPAAEWVLSGDFVAPFANRFPRVRLDFFVSYEPRRTWSGPIGAVGRGCQFRPRSAMWTPGRGTNPSEGSNASPIRLYLSDTSQRSFG